MKIKLIIILSFCCISNLFSQELEGIILDQNNQPLQGANIYFDATTIATISDENGKFSLRSIVNGNNILVISFIGYQTQYIQNPESNNVSKIILVESKNILKELIITKDRFTREQKLKLFKEQFLGKNANAKACSIENENDLFFEYESKSMTLTVSCEKPLVIYNKNLGYKIYYELVNFDVTFFQHTMKSSSVSKTFYSGLSRFEELNNKSKTLKNREKSYQGSILHFFRILASNSWSKKNFLVFKGSYQVNPADNFKVTDSSDSKTVKVTKQIKEFASKKFVAEFNLLFDKKEQSKVIFETETFNIDKFGNNSNIESINFSGDFSELKVADMLPLNYGIK